MRCYVRTKITGQSADILRWINRKPAYVPHLTVLPPQEIRPCPAALLQLGASLAEAASRAAPFELNFDRLEALEYESETYQCVSVHRSPELVDCHELIVGAAMRWIDWQPSSISGFAHPHVTLAEGCTPFEIAKLGERTSEKSPILSFRCHELQLAVKQEHRSPWELSHTFQLGA